MSPRDGSTVSAPALIAASLGAGYRAFPWTGEQILTSGALAGRSAYLVSASANRDRFRVAVLTCHRWHPLDLRHWHRDGFPTMSAAMSYLGHLQDHVAEGGDPTQPYEPP